MKGVDQWPAAAALRLTPGARLGHARRREVPVTLPGELKATLDVLQAWGSVRFLRFLQAHNCHCQGPGRGSRSLSLRVPRLPKKRKASGKGTCFLQDAGRGGT
ncbi:hypothetical protein BDA96_09G229500 [Sorghum bicolor]|uniref:Uncharacterized protein n=1 Tax=Sorghum bicolor TaxID=4558 RepID=A0A921QC82_SORBI|nr:hypothetical protein BDA96_09G229500 [Sorghum bicolor]